MKKSEPVLTRNSCSHNSGSHLRIGIQLQDSNLPPVTRHTQWSSGKTSALECGGRGFESHLSKLPVNVFFPRTTRHHTFAKTSELGLSAPHSTYSPMQEIFHLNMV